MKTIFLGKNCIEVEKTDSTNNYLSRLLGKKEVFEGTVVIAKHQEQGKGQRGTSWESEPNKNLTLSILLQPTFLTPEDQFRLNKAISLGVMEAITPSKSSPKRSEFMRGSLLFGESEGWGGSISIKWPNDIYIGNRKVAGILIENSVSGNKLLQSIIGIGINVNQEKFSSDLPNPTSLKLISGEEFDLKECLSELCSHLEKRYLQLRNISQHSGPILQEEGGIDYDYLKNLYQFDEWANYKYKEEILKAKITGVAKTGKLILETEKGKTLECDFKEVSFCK